MLPEQIKTYHEYLTLKDGVGVTLRPMTAEDRERLLELFSPVSEEDARYLQDNVRDPALIESWCTNLDYTRVIPLLVLFRERAVGEATLHLRKGPQRHVGEVRIFLAKEFRKRGLGTRMLTKLIDLARRQGLHMLVAEVVTDQSSVIKAFQSLGFEKHSVIEDYFMLPDGDKRDVAILIMNLSPKKEEF
jgi:L-amino acid N-acyltransferase YncA